MTSRYAASLDAPAEEPLRTPQAQLRLHVVPVSLAAANAFVELHHRHHAPVIGHKFSIGIEDESDHLRGVVIVGRPVARARDDGLTLEVTRLATDGCR